MVVGLRTRQRLCQSDCCHELLNAFCFFAPSLFVFYFTKNLNQPISTFLITSAPCLLTRSVTKCFHTVWNLSVNRPAFVSSHRAHHHITRMDHLNRLSSYFADKERKRLDNVVRDSRTGLPEMTVRTRLSCFHLLTFLTLMR